MTIDERKKLAAKLQQAIEIETKMNHLHRILDETTLGNTVVQLVTARSGINLLPQIEGLFDKAVEDFKKQVNMICRQQLNELDKEFHNL